MHYFQFNIGDYHSHTSHLDLLEDIAYRRMLDWCYLHEEPLPETIDEIGRIIRMRSHLDCITNVLDEFFQLCDDGYYQNRIDREVAAFHAKSTKAKASANARWDKNKNKNKGLSGDANALRPDSERNAIQEPLNKKQEPLNKKEPKYTQAQLSYATTELDLIKLDYPSLKSKPEVWADELRKLIDIDGYTSKEVDQAWRWVRADSFWSDNCRSIPKLREKDKDGIKFIDRFLKQINQPVGKSNGKKPMFDPDRDYVTEALDELAEKKRLLSELDS